MRRKLMAVATIALMLCACGTAKPTMPVNETEANETAVSEAKTDHVLVVVKSGDKKLDTAIDKAFGNKGSVVISDGHDAMGKKVIGKNHIHEDELPVAVYTDGENAVVLGLELTDKGNIAAEDVAAALAYVEKPTQEGTD